MTVQAQAATASALTLTTGTCCLPHPDKVDTGGEDAFFVSEDKSALGVADGVGGWRESGIDPGDYSRSFMRTACAFVDDAANRAGREGMKGWEELARAALAVRSPQTHHTHRHVRTSGTGANSVLIGATPCTFVRTARVLGDNVASNVTLARTRARACHGRCSQRPHMPSPALRAGLHRQARSPSSARGAPLAARNLHTAHARRSTYPQP